MKQVRAWVWAGYVALGVIGCAAGSHVAGTGTGSFGGTEGSDDAGSDGAGAAPCSTCSADDGGLVPPGSLPPPSDESGVQEDAASTPTPDDASGTPVGLPPFSLPDGGLGGSSPASGDGGACTTKICIDPVFDCPLQGCFNGCTDFHCM